MEAFFNYSLQLNLYLIILLAVYHWGIRRSTNFTFNRKYLLTGIVVSLFLPLLKLELSTNTFGQIPQIQFEEVNVSTAGNTGTNFSIVFWLTTIYFLGLVISLSRFTYGAFKIYQLKKSCVKTESYYQVSNSKAAFSFLQNIFIGDQLNEEEKDIILKHEKVHLSKFHYVDLLLLQLLESLLFYNPFIYRFNSLFKEVHEYEADHYSIEKEDQYIAHLLNHHFEIKEFSIIHQFNSNHLKSRIMRIKNREKRSANPAVIIISILLFGGVFILNQEIKAQNEGEEKQLSQTEKKAERAPEYPGGDKAIIEFLAKNTKYPKSAKENKIEGTVFLQLTISDKGEIDKVNMLRGIKGGEELNEEAIRAAKSIPEKWKPAMKNGKAVAAKIQIPIRFDLPKEKEE